MSKELANFNKKYSLEVSEDTVELDALSKKIGDEGLKLICSIKFKKLEQLLLEENDIKNIDILAKNNLGTKLIALDLSTNKISSLEVLSKLNFPGLNHQISSIDILAKVNFPKLKELNLSSNKISSIDILAKVNFQELKDLDLSKNQISNIAPLSTAKFPNLEDLSLDQNKINSIDILAKMKCDKLKKLKLEKNNLKSINILEKISFSKLNYLSIGDDTLGDNVDCLTKIKFGELEDIYFFEEKGITFNFISCDDDNDMNFDNDDLNIDAGKTGGDGFEGLLNDDVF